MRQPRSPLLSVYGLATAAAEPGGRLLLSRRLKAGKEDGERLGERSGHATRERPDGSLVWVHGASVGEFQSLLPLIGELAGDNLNVLVTTGTLTSARLAAKRLPAGVIHQFVPLDFPEAVQRFYEHWRPGLVIFAESELWPNLMYGALDRGIPLGIVNGRMSARSFRRWRSMGHAIRPILSRLDLCLAQSEADAARYRALGAAFAEDAGNLKYDARPLPFDADALNALKGSMAGRPVWLLASSHAGEDSLAIEAHRGLAERHPGLLTVLAPRHPQRAEAIMAEALAAGLHPACRTKHPTVPPDCDLYIADTLGELGVLYRTSSIALIGGSLLAPGGGHNPIEAAQLGCAVLHGPFTENFADIYEAFSLAAASSPVADVTSLVKTVDRLLRDPGSIAMLAANARRTVSSAGGATKRVMRLIEPLLPKRTLPGAVPPAAPQR